MEPITTLEEALQWANFILGQAGWKTPSLEAEVLLAHTAGLTRAQLWARFDQSLEGDKTWKYRDLVQQLAEGYPLAYLVGEREFMSLVFRVNPEVLVPRSETELLVEEALGLTAKWPERTVRVVDVGTGSGAIAVSMAHYCHRAEVWAVDLYPGPLEVARQNARAHRVEDRIHFLQGDLLQGLFNDYPDLEGGFDLILSNPPYIPRQELAGLPPQVRREPVAALDGGPGGLAVFQRLVPQTCRAAAPGGYLLLETGADQGEAVSRLAEGTGCWEQVEVKQDGTGRDRLVVAGPRR